MASIEVKGLREAQKGMLEVIAAISPKNGLAEAVKEMGLMAFRASITFTHVDDGLLKASRMLDLIDTSRGPIALIQIREGTPGKKGGTKPIEYDVYEQFRGGSHATYARVIAEQGFKIGSKGLAIIIQNMPKDTG